MPRIWLFVLLAAWAAHSSASSNIAALLEQAESKRSADPAAFGELLRKLNDEAEAANGSQRQQLQYLNAYQKAYSGNYDQAIADAKQLLNDATEVELRFRAGALMVNSYGATREFAAGLQVLNDTLALIDQIDDPELKQHAWSAAAVIYNQVGQYELGRQYAELLLTPDASPRTRCFGAYLRLEAMYQLKQLPAEDASIQEIIDGCEPAGERVVAQMARGYLARKQAAEGQAQKALDMLLKNLPAIESTRYPRLISEIQSLLAELQLTTGNAQAAERHAVEAIEKSADSRFSLPLVKAYFVLYQIALARNDSSSALEHYRKYAETDRAYLDDVKARELAFQLARHESLQKNQTITLLNKQNQVLTLERQVARKNTQNTQLLVILLTILLFSIAYWAYKVKRVQNVFRQLAQIDSLTGVNNRHYFHAQAEAALLQCAGNKLQASLIMFDLDHFKTINDRFGHATGDWVLRRVADTAKKLCRDRDYIGRLGGEEFAILLIGADSKAGAQLAEQCRAAIAAIDTRDTGFDFPVAASFGVCDTRSAGHEFRLMLSQADNATYRSKHNGRNQVSVYDESADRVHPGATHGASTGHLLREV